MPRSRILRAVLAFAFVAPAASPDDWAGAVESEILSPSRAYKVRIIPASDYEAAFRPSANGPHATAVVSRKSGPDANEYTVLATFRLLNPVAPVDVFIADNGNILALDNWHTVGHGRVLVLYRANGSLVRSYSLNELFSADEIRSFPVSVSSIWWRKPLTNARPGSKASKAELREGQRSVAIVTAVPNRIIRFDLESGELRF